jgi:hypothetical protein
LADQAEQVEMARIAIIRAFRDAAEAGERWFTGDITPLLAVEDGQTNFEGLAKIKLYPRPAVEWLLSKPKREHLVPTSLQRFLQSGGEPTNAQVPTARRPVTEKRAERFAAHYIKSEQAAGRSPTLVVYRQEGQAYAMSPCAFWSGSILATSSIALLHFGQPTASFRVVSDTTNLNSAHPH